VLLLGDVDYCRTSEQEGKNEEEEEETSRFSRVAVVVIEMLVVGLERRRR
jgi:hypothetical protein